MSEKDRGRLVVLKQPEKRQISRPRRRDICDGSTERVVYN